MVTDGNQNGLTKLSCKNPHTDAHMQINCIPNDGYNEIY